MQSAVADLRAEGDALFALVSQDNVDGDAVTPFHGWRVRQSIAKLATIDRIALLCLTDPPAFAAERDAFVAGTRAPRDDVPPHDVFRRMAVYEDALYRHLAWPELVDSWRSGLDALGDAALARDPAEKVPWFGPPMRIGSLLSARQMEIWAYGQDIFDRYRTRRVEGTRLHNVVEFAVRTFGFSFANRGLAVPAHRPWLRLAAPDGAIWEWGVPGADRITGDAVDFCLVAAQRRNVRDTALVVEGAVAATWMRIAQSITGPPIDPPVPGERVWSDRS